MIECKACGLPIAVDFCPDCGEEIEREAPAAEIVANMAADRREEMAGLGWVEIGGFCESCAKFREGDGFTYCEAQRRKMGTDDFCSRWRPWCGAKVVE